MIPTKLGRTGTACNHFERRQSTVEGGGKYEPIFHLLVYQSSPDSLKQPMITVAWESVVSSAADIVIICVVGVTVGHQKSLILTKYAL